MWQRQNRNTPTKKNEIYLFKKIALLIEYFIFFFQGISWNGSVITAIHAVQTLEYDDNNAIFPGVSLMTIGIEQVQNTTTSSKLLFLYN